MSEVRTFLFADIRGYTSYTRVHGDEAGATLAQRFTAIAETLAPAYDGALRETRGDEVAAIGLRVRFIRGGRPLDIRVEPLQVTSAPTITPTTTSSTSWTVPRRDIDPIETRVPTREGSHPRSDRPQARD